MYSHSICEDSEGAVVKVYRAVFQPYYENPLVTRT